MTILNGGNVVFSKTDLAFPIRIMREGDDALAVLQDANGHRHLLGTGHADMSRQHLLIASGFDGKLTVSDQSSNGVYMRDGVRETLIGQGHSMDIATGQEAVLRTVGFEIRLTAQLRPNSTRSVSGLIVEVNINGRMRRHRLDEAPVIFEDDSGSMQEIATDVYNWGGGGMPDSAYRRASPSLVVGTREYSGVMACVHGRTDVKWNRKKMANGALQKIGHGDLITFSGGHLHFLKTGGKRMLACVNSSCLMLNEYTPNKNCVYCGTRLGDAYTRSV